MIKNIIFDWSGVVKDAVKIHLSVVNKIFDEFGVNHITLDELKENWVQPYMGFYNKYIPNVSAAEEQVVYEKAVFECPEGEVYLTIADSIKKFKEKGIKMYVVSSDLQRTLLSEIKRFNLENIFHEVYTDIHDKTETALSIIKKNNLNLEETIFIGDSNHEVEVSKEIGIKSGAVTWGFQTEERLAKLNPDYIIHNLEELEKIICQQ